MTPLQSYEQACQWLADEFVKKYFGKSATEVYWIANKVGEILAVNDYFFGMDDMAQFIRYKYTKADMFEYYDYTQQAYESHSTPDMNIYAWRFFKKQKKK